MPPASALVGLAPVVCFLAALLLLDSYKLVRPRLVIGVVAAGMAAGGAAYLANGAILEATQVPFTGYTRYGAPLLEELLKGLVVVALVRSHRIGFLVDAAILGFAVGTGFALVENLQYLRMYPDAGLGTWVVRGFGTALMHGGATAIVAMGGVALVERAGPVAAYLPGYGVAVLLHSVFNHFFLSPLASTIGIALAMPPLLYLAFERSEKALGAWLGKGFDADAEMLELINSGRLSDSPVGRYLHSLKDKFQGPVVADVLCYLRLHTELALRAKGILLMRDNGFEATIDEATRAKFTEMTYLEGSIGRTGLLALQPVLHMSHRDLWQMYMLGR
ncbi:MAG TPA: PrsW family glutamic-type intramembrane protease [Usitatibacter sp.]|jgi:RsiW-degrading membrane proteinase PrsW (M82 family)|nr:PrsW family glutamic-type intramembrane protease [Usitatibacter sp.]